MTSKEIAEKLITYAKEFVNKDYKKNALKELENLDKIIPIPNTKFIIDDYPDFNHILVRLEIPDKCIFKICINPEFILENESWAYSVADMMQTWLDAGGTFYEK